MILNILLGIAGGVCVLYLIWVIGEGLRKKNFFKDDNNNKVPDGVDKVVDKAKEVVNVIKKKKKK